VIAGGAHHGAPPTCVLVDACPLEMWGSIAGTSLIGPCESNSLTCSLHSLQNNMAKENTQSTVGSRMVRNSKAPAGSESETSESNLVVKSQRGNCSSSADSENDDENGDPDSLIPPHRFKKRGRPVCPVSIDINMANRNGRACILSAALSSTKG
jgi:hypothetical protein